MSKILTEKNSVRLLSSGFIIIFIGIVLFLWKESFTTHEEINSEKVANFSDFISGITGSIWSLAGVILFYVALTEQRKDIKINRRTLSLQVDALNQQIKEFELQRNELEETRKVFTEQSITLKNQRFENTFFQLVNLHHELVDKLSFSITNNSLTRYIEKREVISSAFRSLNQHIQSLNEIDNNDGAGGLITFDNPPTNVNEAQSRLNDAYYKFYYEDNKQILSHYFRNIYHIFKFIYLSKLIEDKEKQFYASVLRAQLSSEELFLLLYNSTQRGLGYPNFMFLIREFDLMQNFDFTLAFEYPYHKEIYLKLKNSAKPKFNF
ncbi:putative phage abortive infection protein [Pedobacter arcticus]|uniref:putative phage abortive infection protein n=1 Tax=Pedobacter arcticus TaxID=752140 RepID=UPI00030CBB53|nr:putative phage abortive infection protein [Pedobacter arcticus]